MLLFSVGMLGSTVLAPAANLLRSRSWEPTRCTIEQSELVVEPGDQSALYRVAVRYSYRFGGRAYTSERYSFSSVTSSSGRARKEAAVKQLPPGAEATCYVNPSHPEQAVIERGLGSELWWGLAVVPFLAIGLLVFLPTRAFGKRAASAGPVDPSWRMSKTGLPPDAFELATSGPVELRARLTRTGRLTRSILFLVFCIGALTAVGLAVQSAEASGKPSRPLPGVFLFVGLLTVIAVVTVIENVWGV